MEQKIIHLVCLDGSCKLHFGGQDYTLTRGMCLVGVDTHVHNVQPSTDCRIMQLSLMPLEHATLMPDTSWGICGEFHFFSHPVFMVNEEVLTRLESDMTEIERRKAFCDDEDNVYADLARRKAIEMFYIDLIEEHERLFSTVEVSRSYAIIMNQFVSLLKEGAYHENRTVEHFAQQLCITAKHLHKVCTQVSGRAPSHWIQRFMTMEARFLLRHEKKTQKEVADILGFDSVAHFSRYISNIMHTTPGKM